MNGRLWMVGAGLLALAGCGGEGDAAGTAEYPEPRQEALDEAPTVDLASMTETASGLHVMDLEVGEGEEAVPGQRVTVYYTGWFLDGEKFDSSLDRGETYSFPLGGGRVIKGWDQGVAGMRVGGWRRMVIPPDLAYGESGRPGIPPSSTLVFDVELLAVGGE